MTPKKPIALLIGLLAISIPAFADEGMWTFHDFPRALVKQQYGADITSAWLDRVRSSTVRLSGCTASFVSPEGLILTNHHCSATCLDQNSTAQKNLLKEGFLARTQDEELRCGTQVADVLVAMQNITDQVEAATRDLQDRAANEARKKILTRLEQECERASAKAAKGGHLKCESVSLYQGGQYWLYEYKRYDDVRLVFAPEEGIAAFGGDPDNFQFPRWCLDMSILRAYDSNGKAAVTPSYLRIRPEGPKAGELVLVSGHPGSTDRLLTVAQLEELRDVTLPQYLLRASELRGRYIQFGKTGPEAHRIVEHPLVSLENVIKVQRKLLDALLDERLLEHKREEESALRIKAGLQHAELKTAPDPWVTIAKAEGIKRQLALPYIYLEAGGGFNSRLFGYARSILRGAIERQRPNGERLREYRDTALPRIEQQLKAPVPIYPELENLTLSFSLERMREWLGPDAEIVRRLLAKDSPDSLAARVISGSNLGDPQVRMRLWTGGKEAVEASHDPMIELARQVDPLAREIRKRYEDQVEAPVNAASEQIARARFRVYGTNVPPDATFTLRLNVGTVQGWKEDGHEVEPFTSLSQFFARATGQEPFKVPDSWLAAQEHVDPATKFNMSTNNDIVGGNSGSPLLDVDGKLVGLMFDGNIHSIAGEYWFDPVLNRAVAVHPAVMIEGLRKVYKAERLLAELGIR
jgi:Peptidase S46